MFLLIAGGVDTTTSLTGSTLVHLSANPHDRERLIREPDLLDIATEEFLRKFAPSQSMARTVRSDTEIGGCPVGAGERVLIPWVAANHDPSMYPDPDRVLLDRQPRTHLSFGIGSHRCAGAHLARAMFRAMVTAILTRIPDYQVQVEGLVKNESVGSQAGWDSIPVVFTPGTKLGADAGIRDAGYYELRHMTVDAITTEAEGVVSVRLCARTAASCPPGSRAPTWTWCCPPARSGSTRFAATPPTGASYSSRCCGAGRARWVRRGPRHPAPGRRVSLRGPATTSGSCPRRATSSSQVVSASRRSSRWHGRRPSGARRGACVRRAVPALDGVRRLVAGAGRGAGDPRPAGRARASRPGRRFSAGCPPTPSSTAAVRRACCRRSSRSAPRRRCRCRCTSSGSPRPAAKGRPAAGRRRGVRGRAGPGRAHGHGAGRPDAARGRERGDPGRAVRLRRGLLRVVRDPCPRRCPAAPRHDPDRRGARRNTTMMICVGRLHVRVAHARPLGRRAPVGT